MPSFVSQQNEITMSKDVTSIFSGSPMDAEILKEVLADHGIIALAKNQLMAQIAPFQVSSGGFEPVDVEVLNKDKKKALALVEEFKKS